MTSTLRTAVVAAFAGLLVLLAAPAFAHASVEGSSPAPGALLHAAPTQVTITFDENVTAVPEAVRVYGPGGSRVDSGSLLRPGGDDAKVGVAVDAHAEGTYLVAWRVVSADSHPVSGAFTFSVGRRSAAPSAPAITSDTTLSVVLGAARAVGYAGSALLLGGTLLLALAGGTGSLGSARSRRRLLGLGVGCLVLAALVALLLQGGYDAGMGLSSFGRPVLVKGVLGTTFGRGLLVRLVGALGFAAALWRVRGRLRAALLVAFGAVLVASFAMTGHGVTNALMFVSTSLHVAVASLWIGGLAGLVAWALRDPAAHADTLARFSRVALCCVGVLVVTGGFQAWRQVREWGALTGTTYGRELLVKLGLVVLVLVAAGLSRQSVRRRADAPLGVLRRAVGVELVLGLCVFGVTASLAATQPAYSAYHPVVSADLKAGPDLVQLSGVPTGEQQMDLHVYVFGKDQQPSTPKQMTVTVSLASADLGPLPITLTNAGPGHYVGQVVVPVQGDWTVAVTVRTSAIDEYTVTNPLPIR